MAAVYNTHRERRLLAGMLMSHDSFEKPETLLD